MTSRFALALVIGAAIGCGSSAGGSLEEEEPTALAFSRYSPPQHTSRDVFVAARDNVIVMARRISRDGGATWSALDARLGTPDRVVVTGTTVALYSSQLGLTRWDLATDAITAVTGAPGFASDRTWRVDPATGRFVVFDPIQNAVASEGSGAWTTTQLPQPTATEVLPYIKDLESNGTVVLTASAWGIHRKTTGGSWELVTASLPDAGRDLIVMPDGRFVLLGGAQAYVFDAAGAATGTHPGIALEQGDAVVCEDGAILARGQVSRDLGATWAELLPGGDLEIIVERVGCGAGSYWVLARSEAWGYRLVRYDAAAGRGIVVGNWEASGDQAWSESGPPIARTADGTVLAAGLAWREGEPAWTLRETPSRTWASGDTLFGVVDTQFYTSSDSGLRWTAAASAGLDVDEPEAFARTPDGALYLSMFSGENSNGTDRWQSTVWRSTDVGGSWTSVYDVTATRLPGEEIEGDAHRFVGIAADGAWIATDAVSQDQGLTWVETETEGDRSLSFLTPGGSLITTRSTGDPKTDVWRVYSNGGLGPLTATFRLEVDGMPVIASQLRSVAFDAAGYAYVARGAPYAQLWRTELPVDR